MKKVLKLTLNRHWFNQIAAGTKKEEYRTPSPWINSRVNAQKHYDLVEFRNGYQPQSQKITLEYKGFRHGTGKQEWGATPNKNYLVILLGDITEVDGEPLFKCSGAETCNGYKINCRHMQPHKHSIGCDLGTCRFSEKPWVCCCSS